MADGSHRRTTVRPLRARLSRPAQLRTMLGFYRSGAAAFTALEMRMWWEGLIWVASGTLPLASLAAWLQLQSRGSIAVDHDQLVRYFVWVVVVRRMVGVWVHGELDEAINRGHLAALLLKPVSPLHRMFLQGAVGPRLAQALVALPLAAVLFPALGVDPALTPARIAWALPAVAVAIGLEFCSQALIAACGFWLGRTWALNETWQLLVAALSGWLFPLTLLPAMALDVMAVLPFRHMLSTPIELLQGTRHGADAARALLSGGAWLAVFAVLLAVVWRRGLRRYEASGG